MPQNRKKLIELFIGNLVNAIIHNLLEKAIDKEEIADKYRKELLASFEIAKKYREKINPINSPLPDRDIDYIKEKIIRRVKTELNLRIQKGYENIELSLVEKEVEVVLEKLKII